MEEQKISEIYIDMPVKVLFEGCRGCDRLDILVKQNNLYADGEMVATENELRCTNLYECERYANMVKKIMEKQ